ncbi:SWI/SNF-related matrix-associated actin-dependent regulator of chromatin subfamily A-like protein 1 isoform X1 [Vespa velutina]|uniref:SWI/SNF-related matrix-associated actin-dependent regulator of chromatin subfamily A-like protein 1 isoform X1 n=1 Tax=Vespa velutina TaxID=202808 RepID=UPI001FB44B71|nr:SWI/SNF-related matrix-associated actin-dependent regulator of chromatin subfamily A-like protein 1 isoform X1 [Vespa velutina]
MATVQYTQKEIEKKRLEALQRKRQIQSKVTAPFDPGKIQQNQNIKLPIKSSSQNASNFRRPITDPILKSEPNSSQIGPMRKYKTNNRYTPMTPQKFFGINSVITGKCYMITNERFAIEISSYLPSVIEIFKTVNSRIYDIKTKIWNFHLKDYDNLIKKLLELKSNLSIIQIPKSVLQIFQKNLNSPNEISSIDLSSIDATLRDMLMPFQQEGICYGISKNGCCIIADDMGLGKTLQALGIAYYFKDSWPLLIVAPSSVRYQWSEAIYNFLPSIPAHYVHQFTNAKDFVNDVKIVIVSYDILVRAVEIFRRRIFGFVILDESHILKNNKTARFNAVQSTVSNARHIILLSGTPALSRPIELYTQVNLVLPNFMGFQEYGIRYCAGEKKLFGWDFTGSSNMQELQLLLKSTCMIRRLKADVLNQLPSKIRQVIILNPDLIKVGTKEMEDMSKELEQKVSTGLEHHNALLQYYNTSSFVRLKAVCKHVTQLFETKQKCLVYAHHQHVLDAICDIAESMEIEYIRIDGRTSSNRRKDLINNFQDNTNCLAAILSITAANAGITLTAAQLVVFAELFWNPGILCQAEDRVHRIGQDSNVVIQYLVAKQTADDHLWSLIQRKINILCKVGLNQNILMDEAEVTNQVLKQNDQLKIDFFMEKTPKKSLKSDDKMDISDEINNDTSLENNEEKEEISIKDIKELLNLGEEDLQNCDWNF